MVTFSINQSTIFNNWVNLLYKENMNESKRKKNQAIYNASSRLTAWLLTRSQQLKNIIQVHYRENRDWDIESANNVDFTYVTVHELGHYLGKVLNPFYKYLNLSMNRMTMNDDNDNMRSRLHICFICSDSNPSYTCLVSWYRYIHFHIVNLKMQV